MEPPKNAGKPWTSEEETKLLRAFEAGAQISQLARQFGRTPQAIQGRLYRLGKVSQWQLTPQRDNQTDSGRTRQQVADKGGVPAVAARVSLDFIRNRHTIAS